MNRPLHVLVVEDSEDDCLLLLRELKRGGYAPQYRRVDTPEALSAALQAQAWDIIVADYAMPHFNGIQALGLLKRRGLDIPFILVSGTIGEETAVAAMRAGAADYIMKNNLTRLAPAVERELREAQARRERRHVEEELRKSDERFRLTVEGIRDYAIYMLDPAGRVVNWNSGAERILGYRADEILGQAHVRFYGAENGAPAQPAEALRRAAEEGRFEEEGWRARKDGTRFWAEVVITLLRDRDGSLRGFVGVTRDITERKHAQEEIQRQLERLRALNSIELAISASLDLRLTLNIILDQVTAQLGVDAAAVLLLDAQTQMLEYAAGRGFHGSEIDHTQLRVGEGFAGRAAMLRQTITAIDRAELDQFVRKRLIAAENFKAYSAAPLIAKGEVMGVLEIFHRTDLAPDPAWHEFLNALVREAAIAIDNARLFEDLQRKNAELLQAYNATIEGWSRALDLRDKETEGHTQRVTEMTIRLARAMGISEAELVHVRRGALLHDIGKMGIPDNILLKPGGLTDEEWEIMRRHPSYARDLLAPIAFLKPALDIPYCHHERFDGSGYPAGLSDGQIPLVARIFAVVDVWDALSSDRPYRSAWTLEEVRDYILAYTGKHFDPNVVQVFMDLDSKRAK